MPALQQEYDYYEYARRRLGAVRNAVPSSSVRKSTANTRKAPVNTVKVSVKNLKTTTTRDVTRNATRIATRDDSFIQNKRKTTTKKVSNAKTTSRSNTVKRNTTSKKASIDPVVFNNKKTYQKPQEMTLKKPQSNIKSKVIQNQKARVKEMLKKLAISSMVFAMFFLICYRYSMINESFNELNDLKNDVRNKQTVNAQLESNIKKDTDLAYIENYAKYQLGMQKPKESQIQKISIGKQDKIILPVEIEEEKEESIFSNIVKDIRKILD